MESFDRSVIDAIVKKYAKDGASLISILRDVQSECGYLPKEALQYVSQKLNVPLSKIFCVATFYSSFSLEPRGKNLVSVCSGTACHVRHGDGIANKLTKKLKLSADKKTSADRAFTLEKVRCMGCCSVAPAVRVNEDTYGQVTQDAVNGILKRYRKT
jgi:NADH-quinone oxidoreductase subunit E